MTAIVQRPGREVVAFEMRVRLALAVPRGGVGNSSRLRSRRRGARANRVRPTPVDPRGMNSGTTYARKGGDERSRRPSGCPRGPTRSGCVFVEHAVRVQIAAGALWIGGRRSMRSLAERVDAGASPARSMPQWLKGRSACVVNRRMPVRFRPAAHGRVAQRTEHLSSKERDAGSTPAASAPLSSTGKGWLLAKEPETVRFRPGASLGVWCNGQHAGLRSPSVGVRVLARPSFDSRDETPIYPVPSGFGSQ